MSLWSKIVVVCVVLAIVVPMMVMILRRWRAGKPLRDSGISSGMPPLPPGGL